MHTPPLGTIAGSPAAPAAPQPTPPHSRAGSTKSRHRATASDNYYEDVDPRFTQPDPPPVRQPTAVPTLLLPGGYGGQPPPASDPYAAQAAQPPQHMGSPPPQPPQHMGSPPPPQHRHGSPPQPRQYLETQPSYDDGSASDQSGFTSVSQRGVNPNWQPGPSDPGVYGPGGVPYRNRPPGPPQPPQRERDFLLQGNPDFELPASRGGRAPPGRGGPMRAGSANGGGYAAAGSL